MRATMVSVLQKEFAHLNFTYSIGGQISFDVFPKVTRNATRPCRPATPLPVCRGSRTEVAGSL